MPVSAPTTAQLAAALASAPAGAKLVFYDQAAGRWKAFVPCSDCGGWSAGLLSTEPGRLDIAQAEAAILLDALEPELCVNCQALHLRSEPPHAAAQAFCWYDPPSGGWRGWQPVSELTGGGVIVPLGVQLLQSQEEAVVAFTALTCPQLTLAMAVAEHGAPEDLDVHTLYYDEQRQRFALWAPCEKCAGATLTLSVTDCAEVQAAGDRAINMVRWLSEQGCMNCNALTMRQSGLDGGEPADGHYWYDPPSSDWVLACPFEGLPGGVTVPLGFGAADIAESDIEDAARAMLSGDYDPA